MEQRYNILFSGQLLEGQQLDQVRAKLATLFNADQQTLDRLFSGKPQVLKRDCDKSTAQKYKQAMERAGARPVIQAAQASEDTKAAAPATPQPGTPQPATPQSMSAAERIAALAAAPDLEGYRSDSAETSATTPAPGSVPGDPQLAPAGEELLGAGERQQPAQQEVDTSGLEIGPPLDRLSPEPPPAPAAPDTSHLDVAQVGDTIPNLAGEVPPPAPDTAHLDIAPTGADFSEFARPAAQDLDLDLSDMELAPTGADVLEEKYRKEAAATAPDTGHLSLED